MTTVEDIKTAIERFFSDTSRTPSETRAGLEDIASQVEMYLDALPE